MNNPTIEPVGFVYIITCESVNRVKIGFSKTPERRLQELSTTDGVQAFRIEFCPQHQMVLLPTCPGCGNLTA